MLFKQILLAGALQVALSTAIDVDVNATPGSRVDRFEKNHPKGNRTHGDDHANIDVNHQHQGPTTVSGNVQTRGNNVNIDVQPSPGSRTDKFLNNHPKGNRTHDQDHVNVNVNHEDHQGDLQVGGNVQTRSANVDVDVQTKEGSHTDKFLDNHPKGNRTHDDGIDSDVESDDEDDENHVNVDTQHQGGTTTVDGSIQARDENNVNIDVQTKEGSHTDRFLDNHPKGNRTHNDGIDSDDESEGEDDVDHVDVNGQRQGGETTVGGSIQTRDEDNVDVDVTPKPNSRLDKWTKEHPAGNRTHNNNDVNVDVNHKHQDGKTTVGGSIQARDGGNAIFANRCESDVWIWSVDEGVRSLFLMFG
jgi:hypothetical protein